MSKPDPAHGFHAGLRFQSSDRRTKADDIALDCRHFSPRDAHEALATLVHEKTHHYRRHFGTKFARTAP
jgi:hypothetical protein